MVKNCDELNRRKWETTIGPRSFYTCAGWLKVAERTADLPPFYLVSESASGIASGGLPCYVLDRSSPFPFCRADRVLSYALHDSVAGKDIASALMPSLFLGGRNPAHTRLPAPPETARALLDEAERQAAQRDLASVGMLYVDDDDHSTRSVLSERGYHSFAHYQAAVLDVPSGGFDEYLAMLSSDRRNAIRRERRALENAGVTFAVRQLRPDVNDEVDRLERNLNEKYGGVFDDEAVRKIRNVIAASLPESARIAFAHLDGRPCGSLVFFRWRDEIHARTAGFDYETCGKLPVYFGLLFYSLVEYSQENEIRQIFYSTGSAPTKQSRGCTLVTQHAYIKALSPQRDQRLAALVASTEAAVPE
jgi:predicted N-acyltransferase